MLQGNSGFVQQPNGSVIHVNAPYGAEAGSVFVDLGDERWERMDRQEAEASGAKVITCTYCGKPAVMVDHCWPYLVESTVCQRHKDMEAWRWLGKVHKHDGEHVAVCFLCLTEHAVQGVPNTRWAEKRLRSEGWYKPRWGWTCPMCREAVKQEERR